MDNNNLKPGDKNYGVSNPPPKVDPNYVDPKTLPNKPSWDTFMDPSKFKRATPKNKPPETENGQPKKVEDKPTKKRVKKDE